MHRNTYKTDENVTELNYLDDYDPNQLVNYLLAAKSTLVHKKDKNVENTITYRLTTAPRRSKQLNGSLVYKSPLKQTNLDNHSNINSIRQGYSQENVEKKTSNGEQFIDVESPFRRPISDTLIPKVESLQILNSKKIILNEKNFAMERPRTLSLFDFQNQLHKEIEVEKFKKFYEDTQAKYVNNVSLLSIKHFPSLLSENINLTITVQIKPAMYKPLVGNGTRLDLTCVQKLPKCACFVAPFCNLLEFTGEFRDDETILLNILSDEIGLPENIESNPKVGISLFHMFVHGVKRLLGFSKCEDEYYKAYPWAKYFHYDREDRYVYSDKIDQEYCT